MIKEGNALTPRKDTHKTEEGNVLPRWYITAWVAHESVSIYKDVKTPYSLEKICDTLVTRHPQLPSSVNKGKKG